MKKILITGATGFVGKNIIEYLIAQKDIKIVAFVDINDLFGISYLKSKGVEIIFENDFEKYNDAIDYCLHLASYGVLYGDRDVSRMIDVNIKLSIKIMEFCASKKCSLFINTGSCFEYGTQATQGPISETSELKPEDIYAASKVSCEAFLNVYADILSIKMVTIRPFSLFGKYENEHRLFPLVMNAGTDGKKLDLTGCEQIRDYMFVSDLADAVYRLILNSKKIINHEAINVCSGIGLSLKQIVLLICETCSFDKKIFAFGVKPYRENESMYFVGNNSRLEQIIGKFDYSISKKKIKEVYDWLLSNKRLT